MKRGTRLLPYKMADESAVVWGTWWHQGTEARVPLPRYLAAWDYASELTVGLAATINAEAILASTGLDSLDQVALVLVGDCKSAQRRFVSSLPLSRNAEIVDVALTVPPGQIADSIELSAALVLSGDVPPRKDRAQRAGSRLTSSPTQTVLLEGEASRFPTEPISFSAAGFEAAPWTVHSVAESLDDSLMGTVRLLINEDHPWGQELLADASIGISKQLQVDVFRSLVLICAALSDVAGDFEDASIGGVVDYMCHLYLRRSLAETVKIAEAEPLRFDRLLYSAVTP